MLLGRHFDEAAEARAEAARRKIVDCDSRLAKYRQRLDAGADAAVVATWMAEVQGERLIATSSVAGQLNRDPALGHSVAPGHLSDPSALEHHRVDDVPSELHRSHHLPECPQRRATRRP